ncbi:MAG: hypothetical protein K2G36_12005 [Ruminococcus sp.]|nr:hypothetical protein [Ruminococcus sp.]
MKNYFFIDYESVHQNGMNGIEKLTENDKVIIFYTPANETLSFALYKKMISSDAVIELYRVQNGGKNAVNFQVCTFIGYILGNIPEAECHIISNDTSYEYVLNFWKERNTEISMSSDILKIIQKKSVVNAPALNAFEKILILFRLSEQDKLLLLDIIRKGEKMYSYSDCLYVKGEISRNFSPELYNAIKPYLLKGESL